MQDEKITLEEIRAAAQFLANRRNDTAAASAVLNAEIKAATAPILEAHKAVIDKYAADEAAALKVLDDLLVAAPQLFKQPRSITVDGVRTGYKREADTLDWGDDSAVIAAIKAHRPDLAPVLIRTQESLVVDALAGLEREDQARFGIRTVTGADRRFITIGDNDAAMIAKVIIEDARRRQGEDEKPRAVKGKAKAKVAEAAA